MFVVSMGAEVTKVHRIIKLLQDYIIRYYIELITDMRATAKNEHEGYTFKLLKNALFGKTSKNPLTHIEAKLLTDDYELPKSVSKPTLKDIFRHKDFGSNRVLIIKQS